MGESGPLWAPRRGLGSGAKVEEWALEGGRTDILAALTAWTFRPVRSLALEQLPQGLEVNSAICLEDAVNGIAKTVLQPLMEQNFAQLGQLIARPGPGFRNLVSLYRAYPFSGLLNFHDRRNGGVDFLNDMRFNRFNLVRTADQLLQGLEVD